MKRPPHRIRMGPRQGNAPFVTFLAAAVLVLLPALAWLQYSWLEQIAMADRERRERTLRTATSQLAQDLENEIEEVISALRIESSIVDQEAWSTYAARYQAWADSAIAPHIVKSIYVVDNPEQRDSGGGARPTTLRVWTARTRTFEPTAWPAELENIRLRFSNGDRHLEIQAPGPRPGRGSLGFDRRVTPLVTAGSEQAIVVPVMRFTPSDRVDATEPPQPPDVKLLGFTIIRLDLTALGKDVLPALVQRHLFDDRSHSDYLIAVVRRDDPSHVVYESAAGAATAALAKPDASVALLGARLGPMLFMGERPEGAPRRVEGRVVVSVFETRRGRGDAIEPRAIAAADGHWRLVATHRTGSLEAAVAAARTRNLALSSGILALLAAAIALIVVSARRADRLGRQQLEFVAAVSHELRTPVSVIGAAAGNLADGVVDEPERVKKYGATIQGEARRLGETVERVLQLAGIAAGRALAARAMPAANLIEEAVAASRPEIDSAGATVEVHIAPELLNLPTDPTGVQRVVGDPAALRSAIQNLISNAIKYGGDQRKVRVTATAAAHQATRITVEDRGFGIAAEDRKHIFEPFYRGREAVARQIQGSGLGLHLVRRIVEAHGGSVSVQSEPGRGSAFTIELPGVHEIVIKRVGARDESPVAAGLGTGRQ